MTRNDHIALLISGLAPSAKFSTPPAPGDRRPRFWPRRSCSCRRDLPACCFWPSSFTSAARRPPAPRHCSTKGPGPCRHRRTGQQWITPLPFASPTTFELVAGFFLFRAFDISPPPVRASENWLPSGYGVMIDDVLAGVYACLSLAILHWLR